MSLFLYDCLRLSFLLALLSRFTGDLSGPGGMFQAAPDSILFPSMVYMAPNALFPLMALFLLIRFDESKGFIPLYASGKIIAAAALFAWIAFTSGKREFFPPSIRWSFFMAAADLASAAGVFLLGGRSQKTAALCGEKAERAVRETAQTAEIGTSPQGE